MSKFVFRFASVLDLRRQERDRWRSYLAMGFDALQKLEEQEQGLEADRMRQFDEMRSRWTPERVDTIGLARRQWQGRQLLLEMQQVREFHQKITEQAARIREELIKADQAVRVLEKLEETQRREYEAQEERRESAAREDTWASRQRVLAIEKGRNP